MCRGTINASPSLRWWLFANYGSQQVCPEMLKRGAPLQLASRGNTVGRFFPNQCRVEINEGAHTMALHFGGTGYAWTPLAGRMGFQVEASMEYVTDFYVGEDDLYVWAKPNRVLREPEFKVGSFENKAVDWATRGTPVGYLTQNFGQQILNSTLAQGFTVVRTRAGDKFSLGLVLPPAIPKSPFSAGRGERVVFGNETVEIHGQQVDFIGPLEVARSDQTLYLRFFLNQGPAVEALLYPAGQAAVWREGLQLGTPLAPPPVAPYMTFPIQPGMELSQRLKLGPGLYYLVIDNSNKVGTLNPPWNPLTALGGNTAVLSYVAELGADGEGG